MKKQPAPPNLGFLIGLSTIVSAASLFVGAMFGLNYEENRKRQHEEAQKAFDKANKETPIEIFGPSKILGDMGAKEGAIWLPTGAECIITFHTDGKTTVTHGPDHWRPLVFTGGRIRLISGTNSIVIEK